MSDFDEEAERERLREKYERDEEKREVTEKMSELLLQGATMTNAHCQDCNDPIFRYDGQEFCPTCEKAVRRETGDQGDGAAEDDQAESGDDATTPTENGDQEEIEVATPDETRVRFGGDAAGTEDGEGGDAPADESTASGESPGAEQPSAADRVPARPDAPSAAGDVSADAHSTTGDLGAAKASLARTVTRLAREAEASDDVDRTRALLAATTEAADALGAVREADR